MRYTPHTDADVQKALSAVGVERINDLFADVPAQLLDPEIRIPSGRDEVALLDHLKQLAALDDTTSPHFLGGGVRRHFLPSVTKHLAMQSEFVTSYTPYQPEVSQGMLQATFEFQTMMAELTGLPISNASMYDGATTVAEAALLAVRTTRRNTLIVSRGVHPQTRAVIETYVEPLGVSIDTRDLEQLVTPLPIVTEDVAAVIVQSPNHLGVIERIAPFAAAAHEQGALMISVNDPLSLAVLASPGEQGADVAVGDGQTLGVPQQFGGPHFGYMVVSEPLVRQLPGRLVGQTSDVEGRRGFVLTLQAREQHIRRGKAKSNICSNHQLAAVMATINMAALGPQGLREMAEGTVRNAHTLADRLEREGFDVVRGAGPIFAEFPVRISREATDVRRELHARGVRAGLPIPADYALGEAILVTATELTKPDEIDALVSGLREVLA